MGVKWPVCMLASHEGDVHFGIIVKNLARIVSYHKIPPIYRSKYQNTIN